MILGLFLFFLAITTGCARYRDLAPGTVTQIPVKPQTAATAATPAPASAIVEEEKIYIPPLQDVAPPPEYVIGHGDVLFINISGKPELSSLNTATNSSQLGKIQTPSGSRVDGDGNIHLPYLGAIQVGGLTLSQAQNRIGDVAKKSSKTPGLLWKWANTKVIRFTFSDSSATPAPFIWTGR